MTSPGCVNIMERAQGSPIHSRPSWTFDKMIGAHVAMDYYCVPLSINDGCPCGRSLFQKYANVSRVLTVDENRFKFRY
jgi:hypothetical protein